MRLLLDAVRAHGKTGEVFGQAPEAGRPGTAGVAFSISASDDWRPALSAQARYV